MLQRRSEVCVRRDLEKGGFLICDLNGASCFTLQLLQIHVHIGLHQTF